MRSPPLILGGAPAPFSSGWGQPASLLTPGLADFRLLRLANALSRVAFAPAVSFKSGWAEEVRVAESDYSRCLDWNLYCALHEAAPLCAEGSAADRSKGPRSVVADSCFKGDEDREVLADL